MVLCSVVPSYPSPQDSNITRSYGILTLEFKPKKLLSRNFPSLLGNILFMSVSLSQLLLCAGSCCLSQLHLLKPGEIFPIVSGKINVRYADVFPDVKNLSYDEAITLREFDPSAFVVFSKQKTAYEILA